MYKHFEENAVAENKEAAILRLSQEMKDRGYIADLPAFRQRIYEREAELSTDLTPLLSVPHARSSQVLMPCAGKMKTADGREVYLLASNDDEIHLKMLSDITKRYYE